MLIMTGVEKAALKGDSADPVQTKIPLMNVADIYIVLYVAFSKDLSGKRIMHWPHFWSRGRNIRLRPWRQFNKFVPSCLVMFSMVLKQT